MNKMISKNPYRITVTDPDECRIILTLPWDSDIETWIEKFKVILKWASFEDETIREYIERNDI